MIGRTKKQKLGIAVLLLSIVGLVIYGVVTYSYEALTTVDRSTSNGYVQTIEEEEDENFFHKYIESFYNRLDSGDK